jgi:hypothetical protein|nr:MAG TPA: hypothetical protein [Caudoviricetes sp.]
MPTFADVAQKITQDCNRKAERRLHIIGRWHAMLGWIRVAIIEIEKHLDGSEGGEDEIAYCLMDIAAGAVSILQQLGVSDPAAAFGDEYAKASAKHPGMTLDSDMHTDESRFYVLAEEVGEVCAALTYDNKADTGHNSDLISEVTQVGGLAIAWLMRLEERN